MAAPGLAVHAPQLLPRCAQGNPLTQVFLLALLHDIVQLLKRLKFLPGAKKMMFCGSVTQGATLLMFLAVPRDAPNCRGTARLLEFTAVSALPLVFLVLIKMS